AVDVVIAKALAKVPGDRFATATDFADALTRAHTTSDVSPFWRPTIWLRQRKHRITALVAAVAPLGLVGVLTPDLVGARALRVTSVAVLPFETLGDTAQEYFVRGMRDALRGSLAQAHGLRVLWQLPSLGGYRNTTKADTTIARELGVDAVLRGTVVRAGDS